MQKTVIKLGIWTAILSAVFSILWFVTFNMQDFFQPVPEWKNLQAYADAFHVSRLTYLYPSLLLAITYLILLSSIHRIIDKEKMIWTTVGLAVGILYATMASINYNIQVVAVRLSLNAGATGGIEMFIPDNTHSVFNALSNSYLYMALSMFFLGFAFNKTKISGWIRGLLLAQLITAIGQAGYTMFDMNESVFIATSMVWVLGAPAAFILLAFWFKRIPSQK